MKYFKNIKENILLSKYRYIYFAFPAFLLSFGLMRYFYVLNTRIISSLVTLTFIILIEYCIKMNDKNIYKLSAVFSVFLSLSFLIGNKIDTVNKIINNFYFKDVIYFLILFLSSFLLICNLLRFVKDNRINTKADKITLPKYIFPFMVLVLIVCWMPYFLTYYPACLSVDSYEQIYQALGYMELSNHHPILYTFFIKIFINIGINLFDNINVGIALTAVAQMIIFASVITYFILWINKKNVGIIITACCYLFFALNPYIAFYSITLWKDILFSAVILLFCMLIYDLVTSMVSINDKKTLYKFIVISLLVSFLRNNGIYILIVLFISLIIYLKNNRKVLTITCGSLLLAILIIQGPVYSLLNIKPSETEEALAIPLQQIGYVLQNGGEVNEKDQEFINKILPIETYASVYNPFLADDVKFDESFNSEFLTENKIQFFKVWANILFKNFPMYLKAYALQTVGFWHIGTTNWMIIYGAEDKLLGIEAENLLLKYFNKDIFESLYYEADLLKSKIFVGNAFSIGYLFWICVFCVITMIVIKKKRVIISLLPLLTLWLTVMAATPVFCEFRYVYALFLCLPFMLVTLFLD